MGEGDISPLAIFQFVLDGVHSLPALKRLLTLHPGAVHLKDTLHPNHWTPLTIAIVYKQKELIPDLIAAGAKISEEDNDWSALHMAAYKGHDDCLEVLLRFCSRDLVNKQDNRGQTPVYLASEEGHVACVEMLLDAGADPEITNNWGEGCQQIAEKRSQVKVLKMLKNYRQQHEGHVVLHGDPVVSIQSLVNRSLTLKCVVSKEWPYQAWVKDGQIISAGDQYSMTCCRLREDFQCQYSLHLKVCTLTDSGVYRCVFYEDDLHVKEIVRQVFVVKIQSINSRMLVQPKELEILKDSSGREVLLGSGAFAMVLKGRYLNQTVAVKVLHRGTPLQERIKKLLHAEARNMKEIQNKDVVTVYGLMMNDVDSVYAIVMDHMSNGSLLDILEKALLSWCLKTQILCEIARGMTFIHSKDMIHTDLKASNILLDESYAAKIADFGHSKLRGTTTILTSHNSTSVGTVTHMAPEVLCPSSDGISTQADVWSMGIVIFETSAEKQRDDDINVFNRLPYPDGFGQPQVLGLVGIQRLSPLTSQQMKEKIPDDCPELFRQLMYKCCSVEPHARPKFTDILDQLQTHFQETYSQAQLHIDKYHLLTDLTVVNQGYIMPSYATATGMHIEDVVTDRKTPLEEELLTNSHLDKLAQRIGKEWRKFGLLLGFQCEALDVFERKGGDNLYDINFNMLKTWVDRNGGSSCTDTVSKFKELCVNAGRADLFWSKQCQVVVNDTALLKLGKAIGNNWRRLGNRLNFSSAELDVFKKDECSTDEVAFMMIKKWCQRSLNIVVTLDKLCQELDECHLPEAAEALRGQMKFLKSRLSSTPTPRCNSSTHPTHVTVPPYIQRGYMYLLDHMEPDGVVQNLYRLQYLSRNQKSHIESQATRLEKNRILVSLLADMDQGFDILVNVLQETGQVNIVDKIRELQEE